MQLVIFIVEVLVIFGATFGIVFFDRGRRQPQLRDPSMTTVTLLAVLCNISTLPYYFFRTRGGAKGLATGVGSMVAVYVLAMAAAMIVAMLGKGVGLW
ncbi:MAG: hypothetical protein JW751_10945 [Polyangiaceae bacterium]|nr:hypothetical protein [Polyangiaceae bacterium]